MDQFYIAITALFVSFSAGAYAQQPSLTGRVVNEQVQPLDLATVYLLNAQDSTVVRTVFPDKKGDFTFVADLQRIPHRCTMVDRCRLE